MKNLYPLDQKLVKLAYTTFRQQLMSRGLDTIENTLPEPMAAPLQYARQAPVYLSQEFQDLINSLRDAGPENITDEVIPEEVIPEEVIPEGIPAVEDELKKTSSEEKSLSEDADISDELIAEMKKMIPKKMKSRINTSYEGQKANSLHGTSGDFYLEDDYIPMGPTFTLMPPHIQI